jgi:hypothetical protein
LTETTQQSWVVEKWLSGIEPALASYSKRLARHRCKIDAISAVATDTMRHDVSATNEYLMQCKASSKYRFASN